LTGKTSKYVPLDDEVPVQIKKKSRMLKTLLEFVEAVKEGVGSERLGTDWDKDCEEFFGVPQIKIISIETEFPLYQQTQACYAINKFLEEAKIFKIVGYEGEEHSAPKYQEMEIKRGVTMPLLVSAWIFAEWRKTKIVVHPFFEGNYSEFCVFALKDNGKIVHDFSAEVKKWMKKNNFLRGERLEYLPRSTFGFLDYNKKFEWESVILPKKLKEKVMLNIVFPLDNEKLCIKHNIPWRRGVLLAGIAGTGKTQLARVLCNVLDNKTTVIWATPKALYDAEKVKDLFEAARYFSPSLLIIEDIDFIGKSRDYVTDPIVGELLTQLDGNSPNHGVFVLATSNRPELLDKALLERPSRFDVKLMFNVPDSVHRLIMVKHFSVGKRFKGVTYEDIAGMTSGFTGAYIKEVITYGTLLSLKEGKKVIEKSHLTQAIFEVREKTKSTGMIT